MEIEDEMNALLAKAYLEMAEGAAERKDYPEAAAIARKAIAYAEKGIYANRAVKTEAALFLNDLAERLRDYYASMTLDEEPIIF